ncbi:MAG: CHAT domain-containing protein [Cyclobacteriaceae bacterium]|nr:MAG: CHAT domain-containing protein [Cyclobacteriaceae bacterium]
MRWFLLNFILIVLTWSNVYGSDSLKLALEYHQVGEFKKAVPILIKLSETYRRQNDISNYALCQIKLADIVRMYGGPNLAIEMLNKNQDLIRVRLENLSVLLAQNHLAKAEAHYSSLRLTEFKQEILKSLKVKTQAKLPERYLAEDYLHLARYYKEMPNQNDSCYFYVNKALRLAKVDAVSNLSMLARIYNLFGYYYHPASIAYFINKRDSFYTNLRMSRLYYDSALLMIKKQKLKDLVSLNRIYHNLGNSYNNEYSDNLSKVTMDKAMHYYGVSYEAFKKYGSPADLALRNWVIARGYERLNENDSAILKINTGLNILMPEYSTNSYSKVPPLKPTLNDQRFITLLSQKTALLQRMSINAADTALLKDAYHNWVYLMKFYQYVISKSSNEIEALHWSYLYGSNAYQNLMAMIYELADRTGSNNYMIESFGLLTSGKYAYLNRNDINTQINQQINTDLLYKEYDIVLNNLKGTTNIEESQIRTILPQLPERQTVYKKSIEVDKTLTDLVTIDFIQQQILDAKSAYIDYYVANQSIYAVIILKDNVKLLKHNHQPTTQAVIRRLNRNVLSMSPQQHAKTTYTLYKELLEPLLKELPNSVNRLIICPDGYLQNVAWDALVVDTLNTESFKRLSYLLKRYTISTVLSPVHLKKKNNETSVSFVGISPDFKNSKRLAEIPFSRELVRKRSEKYSGNFQESFSSNNQSTSILHIATHVKTDTLHPFNSAMYLADDSITMETLVHVPLKPRLAVLNGCSSGVGASLYTEGTISFARAFYRLGAESVLMTLWDVDDKSTASILEEFYSQLDKGNDLSFSLQEAKIVFLSNQKSDELANPYYWAGLQLSGKTLPLFKPSYWRWYLVFSLLALSLGFYFYRTNGKVKG